jgi:hypothetical protein
MDKKRLLIILAAAGIVILLACIFAGTLVGRYLNERETRPTVEVTDLASCDAAPSDLCVVSFSSDNLNHLVFNFQLPYEGYPMFYLKARYDDMVNVYSCQGVEGVPTSAFCTGNRTPLGQPIEVEVYSTENDMLISKGTLIVSAIALPTTVQQTVIPTPGTITPPPEVTLTPGSPSDTSITPTQPPATISPRVTPTKTPGGYSN